jgi:hypothetical protein
MRPVITLLFSDEHEHLPKQTRDADGPPSGPNGHALGSSQRSLFAIETPEFRGSEEFGGSDVEDVVGSMAVLFGVRCGHYFCLHKDRVGIHARRHKQPRYFVHLIVCNPSLTVVRSYFASEDECSERIAKFKIIDDMNVNRKIVDCPMLLGDGRVSIRAVERDQETGISAKHLAVGSSIGPAHVVKEFVQILLCQHRFSSPVTERRALAPVHSCFLSGHRLGDWLTFHHHILTPLQPSEDGGEAGFQVV